MVRIYPAKTFFKTVSTEEDENVIEEIDYICCDEHGNLYLEKHFGKDNIKRYKLEA